MILMFQPSRNKDPLALSVFGDVLVINGAALDLSVLPNGGMIPHDAIESDYVVEDVIRQNNGEIIVTILTPLGLAALGNEIVEFPEPLSIQQDGPVLLPGQAVAVNMPPVNPPIQIDLSRMETPLKRIDAKRAATSVTRPEFARALAERAIISWQEATAFATGSALPEKATNYINTLPEQFRDVATFTVLATPNVNRTDPHVIALGVSEGLSDAILDDLFGID